MPAETKRCETKTPNLSGRSRRSRRRRRGGGRKKKISHPIFDRNSPLIWLGGLPLHVKPKDVVKMLKVDSTIPTSNVSIKRSRASASAIVNVSSEEKKQEVLANKTLPDGVRVENFVAKHARVTGRDKSKAQPSGDPCSKASSKRPRIAMPPPPPTPKLRPGEIAAVQLQQSKDTTSSVFSQVEYFLEQHKGGQDALCIDDEFVCVMDGHGSKPKRAEWSEGENDSEETDGETRPVLVECDACANSLAVLREKKFDALKGGKNSLDAKIREATIDCSQSGACMAFARVVDDSKTGSGKMLEIYSIGDCSAVVAKADGTVKHVQKHHAEGGYEKPESVRRIFSKDLRHLPLPTKNPARRFTGTRVSRYGGSDYGWSSRTLAMFASIGDYDVESIMHTGNVERVPVESGDFVVLCSDGVGDMYHEVTLANRASSVLASKMSIQELLRENMARWTEPVWEVQRDALGGNTSTGNSFRPAKPDDMSCVIAKIK